jgi:hypothetical protein
MGEQIARPLVPNARRSRMRRSPPARSGGITGLRPRAHARGVARFFIEVVMGVLDGADAQSLAT